MEALVASEEAGQIKNAAVETDAEDPSITAEAIILGNDIDVVINNLRSLALASIGESKEGMDPSVRSLQPTEVECVKEPLE